MLFELKTRQLQLIKQNAALARLAATAESDPTWAPENVRVAEEQDQLADRTAEVLAWVRFNAPEPLVMANLSGARAQMKRASAEIAATSNERAAKPQHRALALLTELEQFLREALSGGTPASNPFDDEQTFELPPRSETPAGELEALAARQKEANAVLADGGDTKAEQAAIGYDAAGLGASDTYGAAVTKSLIDASTAAAEAVQQLSFDDHAAARVPAAAAQSALEQAVEAQEKIGRADAVAVLEQVRRSLATAGRAPASERSERFAAARATLRTAATRQQTTGSAEAAQELAQLAGLIGSPDSLDSPERVREVAAAAAHTQVLLSERTAAVGRVVRLLTRVGEDLAETSGRSEVGESLTTLELASQEAQWITTDAATIGLAQQLAARADDLLRRNGSNATDRGEMSEAAVELATALEHGRANDESDPLARRFNAADVDPAYREAVETYFERLSREGRRTGQEN
jgi:hypothetical protein